MGRHDARLGCHPVPGVLQAPQHTSGWHSIFSLCSAHGPGTSPECDSPDAAQKVRRMAMHPQSNSLSRFNFPFLQILALQIFYGFQQPH